LWDDPRSRPLTHDLLRDYRDRWHPDRPPPPEVEPEPAAQAPAPRPVQREALDALEQTRIAGHDAGLVVMATVAELVDWRLARYLFTKQPEERGGYRLRVSQSNGRPLLWLQRERNPGLPSGETRFIADGEEYIGNLVKIALNVARRTGSSTNDLHELLRRWFGDGAGQPGSDHYVELRRVGAGWELRPVRDEAEPRLPEADEIG